VSSPKKAKNSPTPLESSSTESEFRNCACADDSVRSVATTADSLLVSRELNRLGIAMTAMITMITKRVLAKRVREARVVLVRELRTQCVQRAEVQDPNGAFFAASPRPRSRIRFSATRNTHARNERPSSPRNPSRSRWSASRISCVTSPGP